MTGSEVKGVEREGKDVAERDEKAQDLQDSRYLEEGKDLEVEVGDRLQDREEPQLQHPLLKPERCRAYETLRRGRKFEEKKERSMVAESVGCAVTVAVYVR